MQGLLRAVARRTPCPAGRTATQAGLYGTLCAVEMLLNARFTRRLGKLDIHSVQDLFGVLEALLAQQGVQAADAA